MMLVAVTPILYRSQQYKIGERLPADNQTMVEAWLEAGSAKWEDETAEAPTETVETKAEAPETEDEAKAAEEPKKAKTSAKKTVKKEAK